jgi:hypothetical protein
MQFDQNGARSSLFYMARRGEAPGGWDTSKLSLSSSLGTVSPA